MKKNRTYRFIALLLVFSISIELSSFSTHAQEYDIETEERIETETSVEEQEKTEIDEISEEKEEKFEESVQLDTVGLSDEEKQINEVEQIPDINEVKDDIDSKIEENPTMQSNGIWNGDKNTVWEGKGTSDNPYLIKSAEDLAGISYQSRNDSKTFEGVYFKLTNDIYLNDVSNFDQWENNTSVLNTWQAIKSFGGIFLGDNHTIYGMFCNSTSYDGLFQRCWGNVLIENLHIDKSLVINTGSNRVGGIIGWIRCDPSTSIQNCSFSGTIKCGSGAYAGGIVGYATSPANTNQVTIKGCKNYANISGGKSIGGIVGYADQDFHETIISNCTNYGEICGGNDTRTGGIVGEQSGDDGGKLIVEQCNNLGAVSGGQYTGGILGYAYPSFSSYCTINQCYNTGNIESNSSDGRTGGIIGISYASISGQTNIQNCFNIGNIKSSSYAGGIAGAYSHRGLGTSGTKTILQSYNSGNVEAKYRDGIIPTYTSSAFSDCFYLDSCCESSSSIGKKLSESEMMEYSSFTNYDFDTVWNIDSSLNFGYPYLQFSLEGLPGDPGGDKINQSIIDCVSGYTSDEIYAQFNAILESNDSYEAKFQMWQNLFTNYGITDVREGIKYLSNTTDKRYAYLNLTNNDLYCASNFQYMLDHTGKGLAMRALLWADGLVFNGEVNDWLDFTTHMETEYPGVAKYKAMLYDFMDTTSKSIEIQSDIKLVSDLSKNVTGAAKIKADDLIEELNTCKTYDDAKAALESAKAKDVWAELAIKQNDEGEPIFSYKLDESSGFGQFQKAMGYVTKSITIADMMISDIVDLLTLDSKLAVYAQYRRFLVDIIQNTEYIPYQMRWAAALILNELEEGYVGKIKDIAVDIVKSVGKFGLTDMVKEAILEKVGAKSFSSYLAVINIEAFFINKITDIGGMVKKEAYVEGYAYLANAFTKQLESSKQSFLDSRTEENAWDFYYNYNILYRLRHKGEEAYLAMTKVEGIAEKFSDFGYAVKKEVVDDTLTMLEERCQFTYDGSNAIPESCQFATKSVIRCPVNVEVYTADGNLIATLLDGEESDVTNDYGRFTVVYDSYSGDYIKVICLYNTDVFKFRLIGTDEGLVNMEMAQAGENDPSIYYFYNVPISAGVVISMDTEQIIQQNTYDIDKNGDGSSDDLGTIFIKNNSYIPVDSVLLNQEKLELKAGESKVLQLEFSPLEATNQSIFWLSDNPTVAVVKDGKVTAMSDGTARIYCTSLDAPDIVVSCEVTVFPTTRPEQKYTIKFDANGGNCEFSKLETDVNGKIAKLPKATRVGYAFTGWFTGIDSGDKVTLETVFDADTTIYAHWKQNSVVPSEKYTIKLDANGGNCEISELETDASGRILNLPVARRKGYIFQGWFTEADSGDEVTKKTVFDRNTTIYAHWKIQKKGNNGTKEENNKGIMEEDNSTVSENDIVAKNISPKTGDNVYLRDWAILMIFSIIILLRGCLLLRKPKGKLR